MRRGRFGKGSYTIEAALVLPLILTVLAVVMGLGFQSAKVLGEEMQSFQQVYKEEMCTNWPEKIREGQAIVDGFGEE